MKLSAAIRIGSMTTRQIKSQIADGGNGRCALGAALDAINMVPSMSWIEQMVRFFPLVYKTVECPVSSVPKDVLCIIAQLNDTHDWTREQIADWVETIEKKEEQEAVDSRQKKEAIPALA